MLDVAIIGAGIAGLTAAYELGLAGRSVRIFEARDRVGGRAFSPSIGGSPADLGATWVWDSEREIHTLMARIGVETFAHHRDGVDVYQAERIQRGRLPTSHVPERRILGGAGAIADRLVELIGEVSLGQAVLSVREVTGGLVVSTDSETVVARHVIAAVPPSLLAGMVDDAELANVWAKVPVWMGDVAKVVAVFESRFWRDQGLSGRAASVVGPMVEVHDMSGPDGTPARLFGFVPQSVAAEPLADRVRDQLLLLFGSAAVPTELVIQSWWTEAHTTLATPPTPDQRLFGHEVLRRPALDGRLHLVSCETSGVSPGHLNGAVERAQAVVAHILESE